METYSRIGLLRSYGNLRSYWTATKLWKLTVVLDYYEAMETYSRIGLLRSYGTFNRIGILGISVVACDRPILSAWEWTYFLMKGFCPKITLETSEKDFKTTLENEWKRFQNYTRKRVGKIPRLKGRKVSWSDELRKSSRNSWTCKQVYHTFRVWFLEFSGCSF